MNYVLLAVAIASAAFALHSLGLIIVAALCLRRFRNSFWLVYHVAVCGAFGAGALWLFGMGLA